MSKLKLGFILFVVKDIEDIFFWSVAMEARHGSSENCSDVDGCNKAGFAFPEDCCVSKKTDCLQDGAMKMLRHQLLSEGSSMTTYRELRV